MWICVVGYLAGFCQMNKRFFTFFYIKFVWNGSGLPLKCKKKTKVCLLHLTKSAMLRYQCTLYIRQSI